MQQWEVLRHLLRWQRHWIISRAGGGVLLHESHWHSYHASRSGLAVCVCWSVRCDRQQMHRIIIITNCSPDSPSDCERRNRIPDACPRILLLFFPFITTRHRRHRRDRRRRHPALLRRGVFCQTRRRWWRAQDARKAPHPQRQRPGSQRGRCGDGQAFER